MIRYKYGTSLKKIRIHGRLRFSWHHQKKFLKNFAQCSYGWQTIVYYEPKEKWSHINTCRKEVQVPPIPNLLGHPVLAQTVFLSVKKKSIFNCRVFSFFFLSLSITKWKPSKVRSNVLNKVKYAEEKGPYIKTTLLLSKKKPNDFSHWAELKGIQMSGRLTQLRQVLLRRLPFFFPSWLLSSTLTLSPMGSMLKRVAP